MSKLSKMNRECQICAEKMSIKKTITCCYCNFESCASCNKQFFKTQTFARCMNTSCKKEYTRQFLVNTFSKSYVNKEYKQHLEDIYVQQETAKIPETICKINARNKHTSRTTAIENIINNLLHADTFLTDTENPEYNKNIEYHQVLRQLYNFCKISNYYLDEQTEPKTIQEIYAFTNNNNFTGKKYVIQPVYDNLSDKHNKKEENEKEENKNTTKKNTGGKRNTEGKRNTDKKRRRTMKYLK